MKVVITNTGSWGTGSFTVVNAIVAELLHNGHEVKVFFPDAGIASEDKDYYYQNRDIFKIWKFPIESDGGRLDNFPLMITDPHPRNPGGATFKSLSTTQLNLYFKLFEQNIKAIIQQYQPDVIECQHIWAMDHIIWQLGHKFISVAHHSDQLGFQYDKRMQSYALQSARHAEYIIAISEYVKKEVIRLYNVSSEKVITLKNGYDQDVFRKKQLDRDVVLHSLGLDIPKDAVLVSFAGKVSRTKGIDILLQANRLLSADENIHFLILGVGDVDKLLDGNNRDQYCLDRVHFVGHHVPHVVADIHNISKVSVMPSRSEGFGISGLEAMGCGIPLVVTRCGGPDSFAVGQVIDAENHSQLALAIRRILQLPEDQYKKLCNKAIAAAQRFSWRTNVEKRLEFYEKVIDGDGN